MKFTILFTFVVLVGLPSILVTAAGNGDAPPAAAKEPPECLNEKEVYDLADRMHVDCKNLSEVCIPQCDQKIACNMKHLGLYDDDKKEWNFVKMEELMKTIFEKDYQDLVPKVMKKMEESLKGTVPDHTFYDVYHKASMGYCDDSLVKTLYIPCKKPCKTKPKDL